MLSPTVRNKEYHEVINANEDSQHSGLSCSKCRKESTRDDLPCGYKMELFQDSEKCDCCDDCRIQCNLAV